MNGGQSEIDLASSTVLALLDRHMPSLLQSFNLVGSAVDGDFQVGRSDLDFVAVLKRPLSEADVEGLVVVHRLYASDPTLPLLDGIWVAEDELIAGPDKAAEGPSTRDGLFLAHAQGNRNPVTWLALADQPRTVAGALDRTNIWRDPARLLSWTRENVESYWVPWHARSGRLLSGAGLALLRPANAMWGVLGISRLHYTVATGRIASKSEAGEHALKVFDSRWQRIVEESLRIRRGTPGKRYGNPFARRTEALAFVAMAIGAIRALA